MKTLTILMFLSYLCFSQSLPITKQVLADSKGGGGGNFHYMRSLKSLTELDFENILLNDGAQFKSKIIMPSLLPHYYNVYAYYAEYFKNNYDGKSTHEASPLVKVWSQILMKNSYLELENKINNISIQNCHCADNLEKEYSISHSCAFKEENKICLDLKKLSNKDRPVNVNFNEVTAMIWHEISHILLNDIDHDNNMVIYHSVLENMNSKSYLEFSKALSTQKNSCRIKVKNTTLEYENLSLHKCIQKVLSSRYKKAKIIAYNNYNPYEIRIKFKNIQKINKPHFYGSYIENTRFYSFQNWVERNIHSYALSTYGKGFLYKPNKGVYRLLSFYSLGFSSQSLDNIINHAFLQDHKGRKFFKKAFIYNGDFKMTIQLDPLLTNLADPR